MPCRCDAKYPTDDDCPHCSEPNDVFELIAPTARSAESLARSRRAFERIATEHRETMALYDARDAERRAAGDGPWFERRPAGALQSLVPTDVQLAMPQLPDGPDELLADIAEMEAVVARERRALDDRSGARRCRYCDESIPRGPAPGVHPECLPAELPEGARSCTGCAELLLGDDDEFDHDFCEADYENLVDDAGEELFGTLAPPFGVEEIVWFAGDGEDDDPTEPMLTLPDPAEAPVRASDVVRCPCGRPNTVEFVARNDGQLHRTVSTLSTTCACGTLISVAFSWARRSTIAVKFGGGETIPVLH